VLRELSLLSAIAEPVLAGDDELRTLAAALADVNKALWEIEDRIRAKEADAAFDAEFIALARSVYKTNDCRGALKRRINAHLASEIVEEKRYQPY
jgi:hypothetical protein